MGKSLFQKLNQISLEEDDVLGTTEPVTVDDVIAAQEDADELADMVADTNEDIAGIAQADEVVEDLQAQVDENETKLEETPGEVTAADAVASTEHLIHAVKTLKMPSLSDMGIKVVSHEAAADSPATALRVSTEGAKEVIMNIVNTVKEFFKRVMMQIKKIWTKIVVMLDRSEKAADAMLKEVAKMTFKDDAKFEGKEQEALAKRVAVITVMGGGNISKDPSGDFKKILDTVSSGTINTKADKVIVDIVKSVEPILTLNEEDSQKPENTEKFKKAMETARKGFEEIAKLTTGLDLKLESNSHLANKSEYDSAVKNLKNAATVVTRYDGSAIKAVLFGSNVNSDAGTISQAVQAMQSVPFTFRFNDSMFRDAKVEVPTKAALQTILKDTLATAKKKKSFTDSVYKAMDASDKAMDKIAGLASKVAEGNGLGKYAASLVGKSTKTYMGHVALDSVLGYFGVINQTLSYCKAAKSKGEAPAKK